MAVKRQVVFGVASLAALYVGVVNALGLGELKLDSSLNQPLSATISIQGGENLSPSDVLVSLASSDAFEQAGIDRPHFLTDLRFIPVVENRRLVIRVESNRPVREPYLNFLVELRRPNGRMLREYTVLLDPPIFGSDTLAEAAPVPSSAGRRPDPGRPAPAEPAQRSPAAPGPSSAARAQAPLTAATLDLPDLEPDPDAQKHRTVAGDTLWDIAARHRPDRSIAIRDNMLAIKALNPEAFVNGDLNRLRVGQELVLPTPAQLGHVGRQAVAAQTDPAPRTETAAATGTAATSVDGATQEAAAGDDAPAASERAVAQAPAQQESIVSGKLRIEETEVSAAEADAVELLGRLQALEARFNVLLNELDARDRQIASLQAELEVLRQARDAEDGAGALAGMPGAEGGSGTSGPGPSSLDGSDSPAPGSIQAEAFPAQQAQPQGFFATWWPAFAAAGAFLLGLLLASLRSRPAREDEAPAEESEDQRAETARPGTALIGSSMVARPVAIQQPKPVDPLDGVELYVTYGRFAEARAMLDKAIDEDPARLDLRYKQLRVLAELGEASAFEEQEAEILELGGDESRIEQIKDRFPDLFNETDPDMVEQVDQLEPLFDEEDLEDAYDHDEAETTASAPSEGASQLNLNDFTLDPDWDLIEGLNPTPRKSRSNGEAERPIIENDVFESSLHEFPEVEELHADDRDHFPHETESSHKK